MVHSILFTGLGLSLSLSFSLVSAQLTSNPCVTQSGLPTCCVGSYPNLTECAITNYYISTPDPCKPTTIPLPGQQVYIQDEQQNNYYLKGLLPTIVQAEGYVQSYCVGSYLPPGAKAIADGAIRSAHVLVNANYIQIHGQMDCGLLNINCTQSYPGAYDDGGQYDDGAFQSCGKEPYSGVDTSATGNPGFPHYVEQAGDGIFCMRVCQEDQQGTGLPCDLTQDTAGCIKFMNVSFTPGFTYQNNVNGVSTTISVSLPPGSSPTATTTTAGSTGSATASGSSTGTAGTATTAKSSAFMGVVVDSVMAAAVLLLLV
ncbi:hypothetical protein HK100_000863 [Physocladia obscura]|uniref:Uncharacterized protein n=1 Tax=Physocladia obscura TaxID=109957 RepID=A0AAD5XEY1_9FUNG|nr:hypothetical protein HK100_000863 [Physocladia obscura]